MDRLDLLRGKLVVVIDDDALALAGTDGLLKSWGCHVITAVSDRDALASLDQDTPDLIISDFHLKEGRTGIDAITQIREVLGATIPALLISGDMSPERVREANESGNHLLHKPVGPMTLRAMISRLLQDHSRVLRQLSQEGTPTS